MPATHCRAAPARRAPAAVALTLASALAIGPTVAAAQPAGPCAPTDPVTAEINAREGIKLAKAGEFSAAAALFNTALRLDACEARYPYLLGRALERNGDLDEAAAAYRAVIEQFPTSISKTKAEAGMIRIEQARKAAPPPVVVIAEPGPTAAEPGPAAAEPGPAAPGPGATPPGGPALAGAPTGDPVDAAISPGAASPSGAATAPPTRPEPAVGGAPSSVDGAGSAAGLPSGPVTGATTHPASASPWSTIGLLTGGAGALIAGSGIYFALASQSADEELQIAATRPDRARYDALVEERASNRALAYTAYAVGGALIVGGVLMLLVPEEAPPAVSINPQPGGVTLSVRGGF